MDNGHLYGWDDANGVWVKLVCNASGELIADPTGLFENPPTEDESGKGPSSEWAFDHNADVAAHHAKYTDAESRAAIGNLLDSNGYVQGPIHMFYNQMTLCKQITFRAAIGDTSYVTWAKQSGNKDLYMSSSKVAGGYIDLEIYLYHTDHYVIVLHNDNLGTYFPNHLENPPTENESDKAPTSEWAFDHAADVDAHHAATVAGDLSHQDIANRGVADHHAKYTDAEAQTACNLNGTLYHSIPATDFVSTNPDVDDVTYNINGTLRADADSIDFRCPVMLPDGCTITGVKVDGDAGAASETWSLTRVTMSDLSTNEMASTTVQGEDTSVSYATVDNSLYTYVIWVNGLLTNDLLYYIRIKYTL